MNKCIDDVFYDIEEIYNTLFIDSMKKSEDYDVFMEFFKKDLNEQIPEIKKLILKLAEYQFKKDKEKYWIVNGGENAGT